MTLEELTDEELTEAPVEHLVLLILERFARAADIHFGNFLGSCDLTERPYPVKSALAEAWNWLERKGLLGPNVGQSPEWRSVTRMGRRVIDEGQPALARLRAAERLDVDLHPSLELLVRPQFLIGSYEMAVFEAFKAVEVRLREVSGSPQTAQRCPWRSGPSARIRHGASISAPTALAAARERPRSTCV